MWLEPQRGGKRGGEASVVSQAEWVREVRPEKEEPEERHWGSYSRRGAESHDAEGVSVDEDGGWGGESEGENSSQGSDSGGGGGGGEGGDHFTWSKTGRGSEPGRKEVRDSMVSVEDGFVTVSSGGDEGEEEEEEEEEEDRDEEFQDCQEFLDAGGEHHKHPVGGEGGEQHPQYVFCVIGQTLPRPPHHQRSPGDDISSQDPEDTPEDRDRLQDLEGESRTRAEHPYEEIGNFQRDSQTERLLTQWRERNTGGGLAPDLVLDGISSGTMSPEDVEAIHIRLSGAWSMSEEPKRHSQAPHLKWAKNVVQEILGNSEEGIIGEADSAEQNRRTAEPPQLEVKGHDPEQKVSEETRDIPDVTVTPEEVRFEPQPEEDEPPDVDELRGMGQSRADTSTHTHSDTPLGAEPRGHRGIETERVEVKVSEEEEDEGTFLSVSRSLYKPHSCPSLNFQNESDSLAPPKERESRAEENESEEEEEEQGQEAGVEVGGPEETDTYSRGPEEAPQTPLATLTSSCSFRDLGSSARMRRRGIRKTTERRNAVLVEEEEQEGVGRDRRTRIFSKSDDEDDRSKSWGEVELRTVLDSIDRQKRNSVLFSAKLYQLYSEEAQNFEILRQSRSDVLSVCEDHAHSPAPSPPPARRPLPPLPPVPHPHSLSHTGSVTSVRSLPLPEPPRSEGRPSSPRLSISLTQSASLWRDLPGVRNSSELQELNEDQRRLQEIRFEVVTSEASYCRSLDIVVEHFVKSKQLGALLTTQDRNWLFSRLADVRAISHSFLSKLEERMESNIVHFTVCDIIARQCQRFKMVYVPYLTNQSYQDATYQRLMNENPGFKQIVEKLERSPVCQRLPLRSFLVLPFQRITRIKLLVQNIVKRTTPGTPEAMQAVKALKLLEKLIQESNDSISQMKSIESLVSLSARVDFECRTLPLISQSRRLVREGAVLELMDFSLKDTERSVYIHLFNDYLLLSIQKEGGRFTVIDHSPVSELRAENCRVKLHSLQKNLFRLHMSNRALLLRTDKQSDKLRWISALSRPHPDIDFSAAQDFPQMQCIRAFVGQQPDELSLEKADVILVHQQSSDHWVEGTRLSDRHRGWVPESHLEIINNSRVRQRNLSDALKLTTARAAV
ncbi:rho guanine nucleotide exchange factor 19 isoform X1 [Cynoglossus semilaevis]|uniref:rho guanine nucleotide exchange factor 19 isoform X1 n=1 Tax=Cynoglossus semilaevis TaxID=244447 RepID=UPI000497B2F0|nr:rho guanine nucleotide exchange factor 19-like isoform X1 [Cynoglossus semilaevis]